MDGAAVFLRQPVGLSSSCYSAAAAPASSSSSKQSKTSSASIAMRRSEILSSGFCDQGHLQYYYGSYVASSSSSSSGMKTGISVKQDTTTKDKTQMKMKNKKQLKLLKGLSRDLSTFSQIGFGLDYDELVDQIKGKEISEAAELLLVELQKIKANKKELKRKTKEEKARLKSSQPRKKMSLSSSSSSSGSSSSDSECGEIVDMKSLKRAQSNRTVPQQVIDEPTTITTTTSPIPVTQNVTPLEQSVEPVIAEANPVATECCSGNDEPTTITTTTSPIPVTQNVTPLEQSVEPVIAEANPVATECCSGNENSSSFPTSSKKIEVCLGGKCKKSGGSALLDKFQSVLGIEGAVSGCKCMGKCKQGPVVKVFDEGLADNNDSAVKIAANSLCIGVGLEDVDMIVANLLGESFNHLGLVGAS